MGQLHPPARALRSALPFDDEAVLTLREVADRLRFGTVKQVRAAISQGTLLASRPGGDDFRILGADANAWWLAERVVPEAAVEVAPVATASARSARRRQRHRDGMPLIGRSVT